MTIVPIEVGDQVYGFEVTEIKEILTPPPVAPVPFAPSWVDGVANVRGEIVTVISLSRRLNQSPPARLSDPPAHLVLLEARQHSAFAVLAHRVGSVLNVPESQWTPGHHTCERGRVQLNGLEFGVLDPSALIATA